MINQREFIHNYNDQHRAHFSANLFERDDNAIIEELKKVILSYQRKRVFTIQVTNFTVVEDYDEVHRILYDYEENHLKRKKGKKGIDNRYNFISMKDSAIKLLIVDYYIAIHHEPDPKKASKNLRVIIEVPRVVDKYYYKIAGNLYTITGQIIETTYNNNTSNSSTSKMVALKTMFMASRFYRYPIENSKEMTLINTEGDRMTGVYFQSMIFGKFVHVMKYLLARYGLFGVQEALKITRLLVHDKDPRDPDLYTVKVHNIYISAPKFMYDRDEALQSLFYTVCISINETKDATLNDITTLEYWLRNLGAAFSTDTVEKGLSILESLESIYNISFKEHLHLPDNQKKNIYDILVWIIREFSALRSKDNLDISMKRIRDAEYVAGLYGMKVSRGIFRISDRGNKVTLEQIEKAINTYPDALLKAMLKDSLVNPRNNVNDLDSISALKYTYKGVSGLGSSDGTNKKETSIPVQYRQVHPSHLGRIDIDSISSTDPGLTGIVCPMAKVYNGSFSEESEPNTWREEVDDLLNQYRELMGTKEILVMKRDLTDDKLRLDDEKRLDSIEETIRSMDQMMGTICDVEADPENNGLERVDDEIATLITEVTEDITSK